MADTVLTINAGSSSVKLAWFAAPVGAAPARLRGEVAGLGEHPRLSLYDDAGGTIEREAPGGGHDAWLAPLLDLVRQRLGADRLAAVGHRVVHGGDRAGPAVVDDALLEELDGLADLAPLHQRHNLDPIRALRRLQPDLPQVACFDTAFHATMPTQARSFALPRALTNSGIRRYGAHGLNYEHIAAELEAHHAGLARGRVLVAHLGNGASLCAMHELRSVDTTMGMTPLDGLVMGTRCGAIDAGVVLHLQHANGMSAEQVQDLLYHQSGLLGVSGISADMRQLQASEDPAAQEAIDLFVWRFAQLAAGMVASMGGLDTLVFTGGIGEHAPAIVDACCARLAFLGVQPDGAGRVRVLVIPANEEIVIARHAAETLGLTP